MLKKAGIVVLGATAGIMSFSGLAFAGESDASASASNDDSSTSKHHDEGDDEGRDRDGGSCDKIAASSGDRLLSLDNVASNLDISRLNVLGSDESVNLDEGCGGGGGNKAAVSQGDRLISADNLLANADVSRLNVLGSDESFNANG